MENFASSPSHSPSPLSFLLHGRGEEEEEGNSISTEANLPPLGRVLSSLLSVKHHDLQLPVPCTAVAAAGPSNKALQAFLRHAEFAVRKGLALDKLLVPLLNHVIKSKDRSNLKQVSNIVDWLLIKISNATAVVDSLVMIIKSNQFDHRTKLGWCMVIRHRLQPRNKMRDSKSGGWDAKLAPLISSIPDLLILMSESSSKDMPTRLSIMASDCIILLSNFAAIARYSSEQSCNGSTLDDKHDIQWLTTSDSSLLEEIEHLQTDVQTNGASTSGRGKILAKEELLWEQLDTLLEFVLRLKKWNEKSRPLHARGVQEIEKSLRNLVHFRDSLGIQGEDDLLVLKTVLSTCWECYGFLLLSESFVVRSEYKVMLQQWIEGLRHSVEVKEIKDENISVQESKKVQDIRVFFLTCLALMLGHFDVKGLECVVQEFGAELLHALLGQLHGDDEVVDVAVSIIRSLLFQTKLDSNEKLRMETIASSLMDLMDERDSISKAVAVLIADYLAINPSFLEFERLMANLVSGSLPQRQNAISVLSELLNTLSLSEDHTSSTIRQDIAAHLLKCLGDVNLVNRLEVSQLFAKLDPSFVLPALVQQVYSHDEKVRSSASSSIVSVLKGHSNPCHVVCVLLDCISNMVSKASPPRHPGHIGNLIAGAPLPDTDRVMKLIPSWASQVKEWNLLIDVLLKKMLSEPSNPVLPRFLSHISTYLADNAVAVFKLILPFMAGQSRTSKDALQIVLEDDCPEQRANFDGPIFERLSPLLILRVLPLVAFDEISCRELYGRHSGTARGSSCDEVCIMDLLLERACGHFENHEIRKVSAELLGRLLPDIILPILAKKLESTVQLRGTLEAKSCLYALCNVMMLRGKVTLDSQCMVQIQSLLAEILLWPCLPTDEDTFKVQHGCIDCFAIMMLVELSSLEERNAAVRQFSHEDNGRSLIVEDFQEGRHGKRIIGDHQSLGQTMLSIVVSCVIDPSENIPFLPNQSWEAAEVSAYEARKAGSVHELTIQTAFRLCMANAIIRAMQKIPIREQRVFSMKVLPSVMGFVKDSKDSKMKSACLQILFSAVHNLKEGVSSYAADLLVLSIAILRKQTSEEERLAAARLLASLFTSEDNVTQELVPYLHDALIVLESITRMDSSAELRAFSEKLLSCMKPPYA